MTFVQDKQVRDIAVSYPSASYTAEEAWVEEVAQSEPVPPAGDESVAATETDPTVANAGLTELENDSGPNLSGSADHIDASGVPEASNIDVGAANAAGADNWNTSASAQVDAGLDVVHPRDPAETDNGISATPAAVTNTNNWADNAHSWAEDAANDATPAVSAQAPVNGNDGFSEVQQRRGGRGRGGDHRGGHRGGRGGHRDNRERGEGGGRGGRGSFRGDRGDRGGEGGHRRGGRGGGYRGGNRGRGGEGPPPSS